MDGTTVAGGAEGEHTETRRALLRKAMVAGGVFWAVPTIDSFITPAAASSHETVVANVLLEKITNGNSAIPLTTTCTAGSQSNVTRGSVNFARSATTISATATLSTGTGIAGRSVYILQSNGTACVTGLDTPVGTWAAEPAAGPQTFSAPVASGATHFVLVLAVSANGAGNDDYATEGPTPIAAP